MTTPLQKDHLRHPRIHYFHGTPGNITIEYQVYYAAQLDYWMMIITRRWDGLSRCNIKQSGWLQRKCKAALPSNSLRFCDEDADYHHQ